MAIDREAIRNELKKKKEQRAAGFVEYIKKDSTRNLRILEFTDGAGITNFARTVSQYRLKADTKTPILDRQRTLGAPCACCRLEEKCAETNQDSPFARRQTIYYVNAIDVDQSPHEVKIFQIPSTVWEAIAEYLVSDEWAEVLDAEDGHTFAVSRTGEGLNTEYGCVVSRRPWPVSQKLLDQVIDPLTAVVDPGIEGQCDSLGIDPGDLWDDPEGLEDFGPIDTKATSSSKSKPKSKPRSRTSKKVSKKDTSKVGEYQVGQKIECLHESGDYYPGKIVTVKGDDEYDILFEDGETGVYGGANIRIAAESEEPEEEVVDLVGQAGQGIFPDDGEKYACVVTKHWADKNLVEVEWEDGSPKSIIKVDELEVDSIPFDSGPTVSDDEIPLPKRSGKAAEKSAGRFTGK